MVSTLINLTSCCPVDTQLHTSAMSALLILSWEEIPCGSWLMVFIGGKIGSVLSDVVTAAQETRAEVENLFDSIQDSFYSAVCFSVSLWKSSWGDVDSEDMYGLLTRYFSSSSYDHQCDLCLVFSHSNMAEMINLPKNHRQKVSFCSLQPTNNRPDVAAAAQLCTFSGIK